jgi:hypothetical protein
MATTQPKILRVSPTLHRRLKVEATRRNLSLQAMTETVLTTWLDAVGEQLAMPAQRHRKAS